MYLSNHIIDLSKLSRNYIEFPLQKGKSSRYGSVTGEIPPYEDVYYLYITVNLNLNDLAQFFSKKRDTARKWLKYHNIIKNRDLIQLSMNQTCMLKYNNPTYNNIDKSLLTKFEKYGKRGDGSGTKKLWESLSDSDKELIINKRKQTCLNRYGYDNYMKNPIYLKQFLSNITWKKTKPEINLEKFFINNNIDYVYQFILSTDKIVKCYDFYLPKFNMLIEYDGEFWHRLDCQKNNDEIKNRLALENGYKLTRIKGNKNIDFFWEIQ